MEQSLYQQSLIPRRSMPYNLLDTISDASFKANPERYGLMPGLYWETNGYCGAHVFKEAYVSGRAAFIWACNRSGGDLARGSLGKFYSKDIVATGGSTSTIVCADDTFVADEEVWNHLFVTDNNDDAGAAPENEGGVIVKNTATTLTVRTPLSGQKFSAAVEADDIATIRSHCQVIAAASGDQEAEICGVSMASSLVDNYWGWWCVAADVVWALIKASTAIVVDEGLIADTARLTVGNSSGQELIIAYALATMAADSVSDLMPVKLRSFHAGQAVSA